MSSDTYYEILGVEPDAPREEIREAYRERTRELSPDDWTGDAEVRRERTAAVNKAWNVLSDPFQKERYDRELATPTDELPDDEEASAPARVRAERGTRTIEGPGGLRLATTRARLNALTVDVLVLFVITFGMSYFANQVSQPKDAVQVTVNGDAKDPVELKGRDYRERADELKAKAQAEYERKNPSKKPPKIKADKVGVPTAAAVYGGALVALLVALLYTVPSTVATGQTLGKRIFKLRLVSVDGAPAGWGNALLHYGVPISVALAIPTLGAIAAVGMVLWSMRDKSGQGINDKVAKTLVVEA